MNSNCLLPDYVAGYAETQLEFPTRRIYSMHAEVKEVYAHNTPSSRRASDHLPVVARVQIPLS